jgi:hypothetical protein
MGENQEIIESAFKEYKKCYLRSVLLEIFGKYKPLNNDEIVGWLFEEIRKESELFNATTMSEVLKEFNYIANIGYVVLIDEEDKITISEHGLKALRESVLQNMASTAFFSYKSLCISDKSLKVSSNSFEIAKTALRYSKTACWITFFALLASAASFVLALCR